MRWLGWVVVAASLGCAGAETSGLDGGPEPSRDGAVTDLGPSDPCGQSDLDGDGYGTDPSCLALDCDDQNRSIHPGAPEACNGLDDDCDEAVDEELGEASCGVGACRRTAPLCAAGRPGSCTPGDPEPELCNNIDDNCDGTVDEDVSLSVCGVGACQAQALCVDGQAGACTPLAPGTEACNRLDDDCNGVVDDGFQVQVENGSYAALAAFATGCDGAGQRQGLGCNSAMHRHCAMSACGTSGFGPLENSGDLAILACVVAEPSPTVTWAELAGFHPPCDGSGERLGPNCNAAIHRYCAGHGFVSGFGPVEADANGATVTCLGASVATIVATTYTVLVTHHPDCNAGTRIGPACNAAINRYCASSGYRTGFGPVENSGDDLAVVCVRP